MTKLCAAAAKLPLGAVYCCRIDRYLDDAVILADTAREHVSTLPDLTSPRNLEVSVQKLPRRKCNNRGGDTIVHEKKMEQRRDRYTMVQCRAIAQRVD